MSKSEAILDLVAGYQTYAGTDELTAAAPAYALSTSLIWISTGPSTSIVRPTPIPIPLPTN